MILWLKCASKYWSFPSLVFSIVISDANIIDYDIEVEKTWNYFSTFGFESSAYRPALQRLYCVIWASLVGWKYPSRPHVFHYKPCTASQTAAWTGCLSWPGALSRQSASCWPGSPAKSKEIHVSMSNDFTFSSSQKFEFVSQPWVCLLLLLLLSANLMAEGGELVAGSRVEKEKEWAKDEGLLPSPRGSASFSAFGQVGSSIASRLLSAGRTF